MQLTEIFQALGEEGFRETVRTVSIGKLKTYDLFEQMKTRAHLPKLNLHGLRKATPRFWVRITEGDEELAADLAQSVLVCNLDMIVDVLDHAGVKHNDGFFDKDMDASDILKDNWQQDAYDKFREKYAEPLLLFYLNHLAWELTKAEQLFSPAGKS